MVRLFVVFWGSRFVHGHERGSINRAQVRISSPITGMAKVRMIERKIAESENLDRVCLLAWRRFDDMDMSIFEHTGSLLECWEALHGGA